MNNYFTYLYKGFSALMISLVLTGCSQDDLREYLSPEQQELIGRAVNFSVSMAEEFSTRSVYTDNYNGSFNQNDRMRIFRNYYENGAWSQNEAYRTYKYLYKYGATSGFYLGNDWVPEENRQGYDERNGSFTTFNQNSNDSLTWDNGKTVRFRAWSQSNYHNILNGATQTYFYPDFCAADYVNASGPTQGIPLVLRHLGSRIIFNVKQSGNYFAGVRICASIDPDGTENPNGWKDYKYADNADIEENDDAPTEASKTDDKAKEECQAVTEVYKKMCMPAGVDIKTSTLMAIKNESWKGYTDTQVRKLEEQNATDFIKYNTLSAENIASQAKRPFFCNINGPMFFITIPYDMSTSETRGDALTLPACTRFRVYMRDVNNGDEYNTSGYEGKYHIFALADVVDTDGNQAFPNGLKFSPGISYTFTVGYRYGELYVVVNKTLSWEEQTLDVANGTDQGVVIPTSTTSEYTWWKDAIHKAIPTGTQDFQPVFHIKNEKEFLEFINLVNGNAATATSGLYRLVKTYKQTNVGGQTVTEPDTYGWSLRNSQYNPQWIEEEDAEKLGYIFYDHYHPANADRAAYSERDYLTGAYAFYDDNLRRNFTVELDADLDLKDWSLNSIGMLAATPFMGNFDGKGHTIKNVNMKDEYIFGYIDGKSNGGASITNLKIESLHNTALLNTGVNPIYIAGISLKAPSSTNSIARSLSMATDVIGTSYVVGCIHIGDANGALVGSASNMNMFGCMQVAQGITGGALIGADQNSPLVFKPQISLLGQKSNPKLCQSKPSFMNFMCNYYDTSLSSSAHAVGNVTDDYSLLEYIRGSTTDILCAKNDLLTSDVPMDKLLSQNYKIYYGRAPWRVMNYAIHWYNKNRGEKHPCTMHYESSTVGYAHHYPVLVSGTPDDAYTEATVNTWNPVEQPN